MDKPIDEYLREALCAVEERGIKTGLVNPFRVVTREGQVDYGRIVGHISDKCVSITHDGRRLVVYTDKKWTTVLTDRDGVLIAEDWGDFDNSAYPTLTFRWGIGGDLALVLVEFDFVNHIKFVRNSEGIFGRTDDCSECSLKLYGDRIPAEITEGAAILGQTVRMRIDVREELEKIVEYIELEEFIKAVKK